MDSSGRIGILRRAHRRVVAESAGLLDALAPLGIREELDKPRVYYGRRRAPVLDEASRGGFVKLQLMQRAFPNAAQRANVLYLVSSALPARPKLLVWAASHRRMRQVWNQNGVAYAGWHGPGWEAVNDGLAALMRRSRYVFFQSAFCKMASDRFLQPCNVDSEILHNPVDTAHFKPVGPAARPESLVLLAGGTCYQRYRFEVAAMTLRCLLDAGVDARLRFAGRPAWGPAARDESSEILSRLGVATRVESVPPYSQDHAPAVINSANVLLHTKYNDNCPTLVLEAMASGLPVVYSASGGTPELVGPDAGIGVPAPLDWEQQHPPSPEAMADAVQRILVEYPQRSIAARRRAVEHFDVGPWLVRHHQVFERLLGER